MLWSSACVWARAGEEACRLEGTREGEACGTGPRDGTGARGARGGVWGWYGLSPASPAVRERLVPPASVLPTASASYLPSLLHPPSLARSPLTHSTRLLPSSPASLAHSPHSFPSRVPSSLRTPLAALLTHCTRPSPHSRSFSRPFPHSLCSPRFHCSLHLLTPLPLFSHSLRSITQNHPLRPCNPSPPPPNARATRRV